MADLGDRIIINDPEARCPHCTSTDCATFVDLPKWQMHWTDEDDVAHVDYMPPSRDYKCHNCDGEWIRLENES
jgi:hypothetical protein